MGDERRRQQSQPVLQGVDVLGAQRLWPISCVTSIDSVVSVASLCE